MKNATTVRKVWTVIISVLAALTTPCAGHLIYRLCDACFRSQGLLIVFYAIVGSVAALAGLAFACGACALAFARRGITPDVAAWICPIYTIPFVVALTICSITGDRASLDPRTAHVPDNYLSLLTIDSIKECAYENEYGREFSFCNEDLNVYCSAHDDDYTLIEQLYSYKDSFHLTNVPTGEVDWSNYLQYGSNNYSSKHHYIRMYPTGMAEISYRTGTFAKSYSLYYTYDTSIYEDLYKTASDLYEASLVEEEPVVTE